MEAHVTLEKRGVEETANEIRDRLLGFNQERAGPFNDVRVVLAARDAAGELVGGLVGLGFWNGLFIELLWVDEAARGHGIGTSLMRAAESEARKRGWEVCFLSTFTFQAPTFYPRLGYEAFGELKGTPPGHSRTWFAKWLK
ncbi:MAG TPA: GNAT family N-acetyltransferase [Burkholderiales bacterium]|jgi:predicted N-acetyltransferase YhbS